MSLASVRVKSPRLLVASHNHLTIYFHRVNSHAVNWLAFKIVNFNCRNFQNAR